MSALLLFLSAFAFYIRGASVSIDGGDSGEFIASTFALGVPHAPGYPLFQLLGKALHFLMPFSTPSYRGHILSGLIACALLFVFYQFLLSLLGRDFRWPALLTVFFLASRPLLIEQARVVEVFGLNALFAVGILLCLLKRETLLASFLFGLGLGNHHILIVLAPFLLLAVRGRSPGLSAMFVLLGLSVYIYLPIRAHAGPPVNFGDPETWRRFWAVVTRREFGSTSLHPSALPFRNLSLLMEQSQAFFGRVTHQFGFGGLALALTGAFVGFTRPHRRWIALAALAGWIGLGWGFEVYSNLSPFSDIGQWRLERFYLLPLIASVVLMALAIEAASARLVTLLLAVACLAQPLAAFPSTPIFRANTVFRDFGGALLRSAPRDAHLVIDRILFDEPTSALLTAVVTEKRRPDIFILYRPGTLFNSIYGKDVLDLSWEGRFRRQQAVESEFLGTPAFPVRCFAFEKGSAPFSKPAMEGFLYRDGPGRDLSSFLLVRRPTGELDYPTRLVQVHAPYFLGKAAMERGQMDVARRWFGLALAQGRGMSWLASNIGSLYAQKDLISDAAAAFEAAVRNDPYFFEAQYGLGFVCLKTNQLDRAIRAYETAARINPARAEAFYMLGVAHQNAGHREECGRAWSRYLQLEPRGKMAAVVNKELEDMKWK